MNHFHDATELMNFPADEIMQNLGRFLIVFLLALPLDFEIIERCGMAVGVLAVSAIIAKFIPYATWIQPLSERHRLRSLP